MSAPGRIPGACRSCGPIPPHEWQPPEAPRDPTQTELEIRAMGVLADALEKLDDDEARRRVLEWAGCRYRVRSP